MISPHHCLTIVTKSFRYIGLLLLISNFHLASFDSTVDEVELERVEREGDCLCFRKLRSTSCHCGNETQIEFGLFRRNQGFYINVKCDGATLTDPYAYLSMIVDIKYYLVEFSRRYFQTVLSIDGCRPPDDGYDSLTIRNGEEEMRVSSKSLSFTGIEIRCGDLNHFHLDSRHFRNIDRFTGLEINCPALRSIPEDIFSGMTTGIAFSSLKILNTSLESIPANMFLRLHSLYFLHLVGDKLKTIESLKGARFLSTFDVGRNLIDHLPDDIFEPTKELDHVLVGYNLLSKLPRSLCGLEKLIRVDAEENRIQHIHAGCFTRSSNFRYLMLNGNQLRSLDFLQNFFLGGENITFADLRDSVGSPDVLNNSTQPSPSSYNASLVAQSNSSPGDLVNVTLTRFWSLNLRNNSLKSVPERAFFPLTGLYVVDMSFNRLSHLPPKLFSNNLYLYNLSLSNNLLASIPDCFLCGNTEMKSLDLSGNRIRTLSANFFARTRDVTYLDLSDNSIDFLPGGIFLPLNDTLERNRPLILNLEGNQISSLPNMSLPRLTVLNLARNRLQDVSLEILRYLPNLERLNLSHNSIETTHLSLQGDSPAFMKYLKLSDMDLSNNRLTEFPHVLMLDSYKRLNLSRNRIGSIEVIAKMLTHGPALNVEHLDISHNELHLNLGQNMEMLSSRLFIENLKHLDVSWNGLNIKMCPGKKRLTRCVRFMEGCYQLEVLIMAHNEMEVIPVHFLKLPKLRWVDLRHNKIKRILREDFFYVDAVSKEVLRQMGDSEVNYLTRGDHFELPNTRNLTIDMRHNDIAYVDLPESMMRMVPKDCAINRQFARATMLIGFNPIDCGCQIFKILRYSLKEYRPLWEGDIWGGKKDVLPMSLDIRDLSCGEPPTVRGKKVSEPETWVHHVLPLFGICHLLDHL